MEKTSDVDVLMPKPIVHKIGGEELRQQALPVRKLLAVMQYAQGNADLLDRFKLLGKPSEEGGVSFVALLEDDVYKRAFAFLRLLLPGEQNAKVLTDDWCFEHLSNAHIVMIVKTALVQNELDEVFKKAKELLGPTFAAVFRQNMTEKMPVVPAPTGPAGNA